MVYDETPSTQFSLAFSLLVSIERIGVANWVSFGATSVLQNQNVLPSPAWSSTDLVVELTDYLLPAWASSDSTLVLSEYLVDTFACTAALGVQELSRETVDSLWVSSDSVFFVWELLDSAWNWTSILLDFKHFQPLSQAHRLIGQDNEFTLVR